MSRLMTALASKEASKRYDCASCKPESRNLRGCPFEGDITDSACPMAALVTVPSLSMAVRAIGMTERRMIDLDDMDGWVWEMSEYGAAESHRASMAASSAPTPEPGDTTTPRTMIRRIG